MFLILFNNTYDVLHKKYKYLYVYNFFFVHFKNIVKRFLFIYETPIENSIHHKLPQKKNSLVFTIAILL